MRFIADTENDDHAMLVETSFGFILVTNMIDELGNDTLKPKECNTLVGLCVNGDCNNLWINAPVESATVIRRC